MRAGKFLISISLMLILPIILFAQGNNTMPIDTANAPRLNISEEKFDMGYVYSGARVSHTVTLRNDGRDTLRLERPRPTCGCTIAPLGKYTLAPGEEEELEITFNSTGYRRRTTKAVIVRSNDPVRPMIRVVFTANMDTTSFPNVQFEPNPISFGKMDDFKTKLKLRITNNTERSLKVNIGEQPKEFAEWKLKNSKIKPGKSTTLEMKLVKTLKPDMFFKGAISFTFSNKSETFRMTLPYMGGGR